MTEPSASSRLCALVTNDDGINSAGLHALARAAEAVGLDVTVAAPMSDTSGASASIQHRRAGNQVAIEQRSIDGVRGACYGVDSNPGFIALTGVRGTFGCRPDLLLSGVNRGSNTGRVIVHSGTVGAALSAALQGCRAMAVSAVTNTGTPRWTTAAAVAARLAQFVSAAPPGTALNVNVPDLEEPALRGIRWARLAPFGTVQTVAAQLGLGHLELSIEDPLHGVPAGTDAALVAEGFVTVTALAAMAELTPLTGLPPLAEGSRNSGRESAGR